MNDTDNKQMERDFINAATFFNLCDNKPSEQSKAMFEIGFKKAWELQQKRMDGLKSDTADNKQQAVVLTFVIRNEFPMLQFGDSPEYRTVHINLTDEQISQIGLSLVYTSSDKRKYYEEISTVFVDYAFNKTI